MLGVWQHTGQVHFLMTTAAAQLQSKKQVPEQFQGGAESAVRVCISMQQTVPARAAKPSGAPALNLTA